MSARGGFEEGSEKGMRAVGAALEFWVELGADHEGMILELNNFCETGLFPDAGKQKPFSLEFLPECAIEFVPVAVALGDD